MGLWARTSATLWRKGYMMLSTEENGTVFTSAELPSDHGEARSQEELQAPHKGKWMTRLSRQTYTGSLLFNLFAFLLPALYSTLSKLWVANIDSSAVVTTDIYTYIGVIVQVLNDGLPRASWLIIGDKSTRTLSSRLQLSYTLIAFQIAAGALMSVIFIAAADRLAAGFVPAEVRQASLKYVRISAFSALSSAMEVAVSSCTRALDHPDVPLLISSVKFLINIALDLLVISKVHVGHFKPTVNTQAFVRLGCDLTSAFCGLLYFSYVALKLQRRRAGGVKQEEGRESLWPSVRAFKTLGRPAIYTFIESAIRNSLYLWLVSQIVTLGEDYATAWGVFNTIRWGLIMVPVQALEASTLTFIGHNWGRWRKKVGVNLTRAKASKRDLLEITRPAFISCIIALVVEVPICICLSLWGMQGFAYYLSNSTNVALITKKMWRNIDWCYIFYAVQYQLSAILLATTPRWFLYQALGSNFLWILPWAIVVTKVRMTQQVAWKFYSIIFGGALVFDFFDVGITCALWAYRLGQGWVKLNRV